MIYAAHLETIVGWYRWISQPSRPVGKLLRSSQEGLRAVGQGKRHLEQVRKGLTGAKGENIRTFCRNPKKSRDVSSKLCKCERVIRVSALFSCSFSKIAGGGSKQTVEVTFSLGGK